MYDNFTVWFVIMIACSGALLIEGLVLIRYLLVTRLALKRALLFPLPLAVSVWTFVVAMQALNDYNTFANRLDSLGQHFSPYVYNVFFHGIQEAVERCKPQIGIAVAVFVCMFFLVWNVSSVVRRQGKKAETATYSSVPTGSRN